MARRKHYITKTSEKARAAAFIDGRGPNSAYTNGARTVRPTAASAGGEGAQMRSAWGRASQAQRYPNLAGQWKGGTGKVATYTSSVKGRLSDGTVNPKTGNRLAGGSTWTFTKKDSDGNKISQSGRSKIATRRQRYYDVRVGLGLAGG